MLRHSADVRFPPDPTHNIDLENSGASLFLFTNLRRLSYTGRLKMNACLPALIVLLLTAFQVVTSDNKIISGIEAVPHSQPHIVHLDSYFYGFFCSGSLIDEQWVLSAAHCYVDPNSYLVVLGDHNKALDEGTEQWIEVSKVFPHPQYNTATKDFDVMLIKLSRPVELTAFVQKIPLPSPMSDPAPQTRCTICGWGNTANPGSSYPDVLRCVDLPVVSREECNKPSAYGGYVSDNMFCSGELGGGMDACDGDSGGPVTCGPFLDGVVSWGFGCAYPNFPGVNARVSYFHDWIEWTVTYY